MEPCCTTVKADMQALMCKTCVDLGVLTLLCLWLGLFDLNVGSLEAFMIGQFDMFQAAVQ